MTNTRITDVEVLEKRFHWQIISGKKAIFMTCSFRYPVIVLSFSINKGSGGKGRFDGGNGIIREILFRKPLILSVLSERRVFSPYGMKGNIWICFNIVNNVIELKYCSYIKSIHCIL